MPRTPALPRDFSHIRDDFFSIDWGWDAPYLHRAGRSDATDDSHSLKGAAGGQTGYLGVANIAFMSI